MHENNEYIKLFYLSKETTRADIKKTYRQLAKQNHPDFFTDEEAKIRQKIIMEKINEAYQIILKQFEINRIALKKRSSKEIKENDYTLYKRALKFYHIYFDSFFELFARRAVITVKQKKEVLQQARAHFTKLLQTYPRSDWVFDAREKLQKIDEALKMLDQL